MKPRNAKHTALIQIVGHPQVTQASGEIQVNPKDKQGILPQILGQVLPQIAPELSQQSQPQFSRLLPQDPSMGIPVQKTVMIQISPKKKDDDSDQP